MMASAGCRRRRARRTRFGPVLGAALLAAVALHGAQSVSTVDALLQRKGFSRADVRALDAGSVVIRSLDTPVREELAHLGAVYIDAPSERFIERFLDIESFERGPGVPQIGRFGDPARLEDMSALTLPPTDVAALRGCRPGACDLKLSADAMRRFQHDVNWSSPDASAQAHAVIREMILELVRGYRAEGNAALGRYEDGGDPLLVADEFRALLASRDHLPVPVPDLLAYLDEYPRGRPDGATDLFYWTMVDFGLKPTVRVNHVVILPLKGSPVSDVVYAIAIKQLYASHYFHTTLELRFLVDDDRNGRDGTTLFSTTRSRSDGMTGFKGLFLRPIISRRSREAVRRYLVHLKTQVERPAEPGK